MNIYAFLGFLWSEKISYIFSIAILSGIIFNVMMFIISKIGHRPCSVAENHIYKAWLKCIFILLFVFIAIGAWGANDTRDFAKLYALDVNYKWGLMKIFGVSAVSFIFGSAANFVGEAVLVTVSTLSRKK
jgi:hypothetical protein